MKGQMMHDEYSSIPAAKDIRDSRKNNMDANEKHATGTNTIQKKTSKGKHSGAGPSHRSSK